MSLGRFHFAKCDGMTHRLAGFAPNKVCPHTSAQPPALITLTRLHPRPYGRGPARRRLDGKTVPQPGLRQFEHAGSPSTMSTSSRGKFGPPAPQYHGPVALHPGYRRRASFRNSPRVSKLASANRTGSSTILILSDRRTRLGRLPNWAALPRMMARRERAAAIFGQFVRALRELRRR